MSTDNQVQLAQQGGVEMLISLLPNKNVHVQRQAAKALANLGISFFSFFLVQYLVGS